MEKKTNNFAYNLEFGLPVFLNREANRGPNFFSSNDFHVSFTNQTCHVGERYHPSPRDRSVSNRTRYMNSTGYNRQISHRMVQNRYRAYRVLFPRIRVSRLDEGYHPQVRGPTRPVICALLNETVGSQIGWSKLATELYLIQFPWSRLARLDKGYHPPSNRSVVQPGPLFVLC